MNSRSSFTVMFALVFAAILSGCGSTAPAANPTAVSPAPTQAVAPAPASASTGSAVSGSSAAGSPADAAKGFIGVEYSGGAIDPFLCTGNSNATDGLKMMAVAVNASSAASFAKFDVSALKYETSNQTSDSADVKVSGQITSTSMAGTLSTVDFQAISLKMKNDNGWKVCGVNS